MLDVKKASPANAANLDYPSAVVVAVAAPPAVHSPWQTAAHTPSGRIHNRYPVVIGLAGVRNDNAETTQHSIGP